MRRDCPEVLSKESNSDAVAINEEDEIGKEKMQIARL